MMSVILFSVLRLLLWLVLCSVGIFVCLKLYRNTNKEDHREKGKVIQMIIKTYAIVQCIAWPSLLTLAWTLVVNVTVCNVIPRFVIPYAISLCRFLWLVLRGYVGLHSMIVAIARCCFIVYDGQISRLTIKTVRRLFMGCSIGIPVFLALLAEATVPAIQMWGSHLMPLYIDSYENTSNPRFDFLTENVKAASQQSILYTTVKNNLPSSLIYWMALFCKSMNVIILTNIVEAFIYLHIYVYCMR